VVNAIEVATHIDVYYSMHPYPTPLYFLKERMEVTPGPESIGYKDKLILKDILDSVCNRFQWYFFFILCFFPCHLSVEFGFGTNTLSSERI
jgi:hypothetical protein